MLWTGLPAYAVSLTGDTRNFVVLNKVGFTHQQSELKPRVSGAVVALIQHREMIFVVLMSFIGSGVIYALMASSQALLSFHSHSQWYISLFWISATLSSLLSNHLISQGVWFDRSEYFRLSLASVTMAIAMVLMLFIQQPFIIIGAFALFTFCNPIIGNYLQSCVIKHTKNQMLGRVNSIIDVISDVSSLAMMIVFYLSDWHITLWIVLILIVLRYMVIYYTKVHKL